MASGSFSNSGWVSGSSSHDNLYRNGMDVTLLYPGIGEVGSGFILDAHPAGDWRGVELQGNSNDYVLLRPSEIIPQFSDLPIDPRQVGVTVLGQAVDKSVLWKVLDLMIPPEDSHTDDTDEGVDCPYIARSQWVGHEVLRKGDGGDVIASGRINCCDSSDPY